MADVMVEIGAKVEELDSGIKEAKEKIESLKESVDKISEGFKSLLEIAGIALSLEGLKSFIESMAELGLQTERTMAILGASASSVVALQGVAKLTGTDMDRLAISMERMTLNMERSTRDGVNPAAQALGKLGISAKEFIAADLDGKLNIWAEALGKFNPSLNLTAAVMQVGGRGVAAIIPLLQRGAEGFRELQEQVHAAQDGLAAAIPGMAATHEKITLLGLSTQSLGARIFTVLKPAIDSVVESLTKWVQAIDSRTIQTAVQAVASFMIDVGAAIARFFINLKEMWEDLVSSIQSKMPALHLAASAMYALGGQFTEAKAAFDAFKAGSAGTDPWLIQYNADAARRSLAGLVAGAKEAASTLGTMSEGGGHGGTPKIDMGQIDFNARQQLEANMKVIEGQIEQWKSYYEKLKIFDKSQVDLSKMTEGEMTKDLIAANDQKLANTLALYQKELALAGGNAAKMQEIRNKMDKAIEDRDKESLTLMSAQLKKAEKEWEGILGSLSSAFTSQLRGILTGTTTWAQAIKNIMLDLVLKIIEEFLKLAIIKPLSGMLASALDAPTEIFASLIKVIKNMFGPLLAGFTSFFAPELGPGAPAAGAAAAAGVEAAAIGAVTLDTGTDYVPRTGLAMIHQGEAIIPASENIAPYSGGGSPTINLNLSTLDASSFHAWLRNSGGDKVLTRMVAHMLNNNPTLRPSY